jgi:Flp pilus assembly protein TadD
LRAEAAERDIKALRREIARSPWPDSGPRYLTLGQLHAAGGDGAEAVRLARLALAAMPGSAEPLRSLAAWLSEPGDVFYRWRALRDLGAKAPADEKNAAALRALEKEWLEL